ncbi:potassium-transporting ATPase subunit KdpA [Nitrosomonas sp. JL21]|uniref:potassium-transporting ATPase subunit KdpA n=1 Tax=Nitrosomonas sp. JL21 TaxID=153949 RepID=UPI0013706A3F|nr:potassium-transporting ATPase subunit KdpA [Nitrosomonas sp. JL21]MXS76930.1 potassium-transporting ATPase subunit KdpA [Nitrosomonas sp. JL21]
MNTSLWIQIGLFLIVLFIAAWPLGRYLANVFDEQLTRRFIWLEKFEYGFCRLIGTSPAEDMPWQRYATAIVLFNVIGVVVVYGLQRFQSELPFNPQSLGNVSSDSAFNTAISFVTNTNWQGYGGESTMSYLTQMLALTVQNFASGATGIAVVIALIRGFTRRNAAGIGNAWLDLSRSIFYVLLPLSFVFALFLVNQGVIQNFNAYQEVKLIEPLEYAAPKLDLNGQPLKDDQGNVTMGAIKTDKQSIAMGPVASQEAIKLIGTNGGGFFNTNSAHPFENPTPLTNFLEMISIFLIPAALCFAFGQMVGDQRQGWTILATMTVLFITLATVALWSESNSNPLITQLGADGSMGNLEGKEIRFGIISSALFATVTTAASCGAVNAMHDSFLPLGGLVPMGLMMLGEVVFGGVGAGLYGMLIFAILAVFLSGLMIGRTPEYLGKKIGVFEMKMVSIAILVVPLLVLGGTAIAVVTEAGKASMANPGAHGLSEVLYAFTSAGNNNGSAFAGLSANTPFYNILLAIAMWFGRFGVIIPVLAIAGKLAEKPKLAVTAGTLPTHGPLFVILLISTVLIFGALNYVPALALGPIIEHLQLFSH